jgi:hypothetical protein
MMPRLLPFVALCAACRFEADYSGGDFTCTDGVCPEGLVCNGERRCVEPGSDLDASIDAPPADLDCADPGIIARGAERTFEGSTVGELNKIEAMCSGRLLFGADHVYKATAEAGDSLELTVDGDVAMRAYVITACAMDGEACLEDMLATTTVPLALTAVEGDVWIIVDGETPSSDGSYTLTVTVGP